MTLNRETQARRVLVPLAVCCAAVLLAELALGENLVSRPAGFVRITVPAHGRTLASLPFVPKDGSLAALFQSAPPGITRVRTWNGTTQRYVTYTRVPASGGLSETWTCDAGPRAAELWPGEAFWIENDGDEQADLYFQGDVCLEDSVEDVLHPGLNGLAYPFTGGVGLRETALPGLGALGTELIRWVNEPDYADGQAGWRSQSVLEPGVGYFYRGESRGSAPWREPRPYPAPFPAAGDPAIESLAVTPDGAQCLLTLTAPAGAALDVFVQELSADSAFCATSGWSVAGQVAVTNRPDATHGAAAESLSVPWGDAGDTTGWRPPPAETLGRIYLAARADLDRDGDGVSDAREIFVYHTDPDRADRAGGEDLQGGTEFTLQGADRPGASNVVRVAAPPGRLGIVYVDAQRGSDAYSGRLAERSGSHGPKRTVRGGLAAAGTADTLVIKEGGYREDLDVAGRPITVRFTGRVFLTGAPAPCPQRAEQALEALPASPEIPFVSVTNNTGRGTSEGLTSQAAEEGT